VVRQLKAQDGEIDEHGRASLIKGVANDRHISVEDCQMHYGRHSQSVQVDGDTHHVLHNLESGLIRAMGLTPATVPQDSVTEAMWSGKTDTSTRPL
jgi:hypothetical protein